MTDFGAFLALEEGIDGLIHISDMSWTQRIRHPSEILKKGQEVEAVVLNIDIENERLSLGLKQAGENPWDNIDERHQVGNNVPANIVKVVNFGAFAALEDGLEGLIHISELAEGKVERSEDVVAVGEEYTVKIIKIDKEERKLGLSLRAYIDEDGEPEEWKERRARRLEAEVSDVAREETAAAVPDKADSEAEDVGGDEPETAMEEAMEAAEAEAKADSDEGVELTEDAGEADEAKAEPDSNEGVELTEDAGEADEPEAEPDSNEGVELTEDAGEADEPEAEPDSNEGVELMEDAGEADEPAGEPPEASEEEPVS